MTAPEYFSGRPLVAGTINGIRSFRQAADGHLWSPTHPYDWAPGVNGAECGVRDAALIFGLRRMPSGDGQHEDPHTHRVGALDCTCGFYAYFGLGRNPWHAPGNVLGLIAGQGTVTHGSLGFRCERAEIIALIDARRWWRALPAIAAGFCYLLAAVPIGVIERPNSWVSWMCLAVLAGGCFLVVRKTARPPFVPRYLSVVSEETRAAYPGVPVYRSVAAALRAHPLVAPTPDVGGRAA